MADELTTALADQFARERTFKFLLPGVSDPNNRDTILRANTSSLFALNSVSQELVYEGGDLVFGPASVDWGTVKRMQCYVQTRGNFEYFADFGLGGQGSLDSDGTPLFNGETINAGQSLLVSSGFTVQPKLTRAVSQGEETFDAHQRVMHEDLTNVSDFSLWGFELVTSNGDSQSVVTKLGFNVDWTFTGGQVRYDGDDIEFKKANSAFTTGGVNIYTVNADDLLVYVAFASTGSNAIGEGGRVTLPSGSLYIG